MNTNADGGGAFQRCRGFSRAFGSELIVPVRVNADRADRGGVSLRLIDRQRYRPYMGQRSAGKRQSYILTAEQGRSRNQVTILSVLV